MLQSKIEIDVQLDEEKVPTQIQWRASGSTAEEQQNAKAMLLSLWDAKDKSALRIDLWTQAMMIDEMADFYYQTFIGMADTFERATKESELSTEMKNFAKHFIEQFNKNQKNKI